MSKIYKLWIDIEEHNLDSDEFRSLADYNEAAPVPIAEFSDLEAAVDFAESLSLDGHLERLGIPTIVN
jgi:hypothetical protein